MEELNANAFIMLNPIMPGDAVFVQSAIIPEDAPTKAVQALTRIPIHRFKLKLATFLI
jgi:hypothetical protein